MTMPSSGPLNMGGTTTPVSVAAELGLSLTATISMNDAAVRTLAAVGGSGTQWSMSSLYGKSSTYTVEYLVVAGGGGGGQGTGSYNAGGGGGAGGYLSGSVALTPGSPYTVTIGAGGSVSTNGSDSVFNAATATGGGQGGTTSTGSSGGSGGGGSTNNGANAGGSGTSGQGNSGGSSDYAIYVPAGGGGGGAGATGGNGVTSTFNPTGGNGGAGSTWSDGVTYAGGGGGGSANYYTGGVATVGSGGSGGGGAGGYSADGNSPQNQNAVAGTVNRGGGGGGVGSTPLGNGLAASGGSGIVIVRYAGSQRGTGGTVTSAGGYTYHTFTSSGTYTA